MIQQHTISIAQSRETELSGTISRHITQQRSYV